MIQFFIKLCTEPYKLYDLSPDAVEMLITRLGLDEDRNTFFDGFGHFYKFKGSYAKEPQNPYGPRKIARVVEVKDWPAWFLGLDEKDRRFVQHGLENYQEVKVVQSFIFPGINLDEPTRGPKLERSFFGYFLPEIYTEHELFAFSDSSTKVIIAKPEYD